MRIAARVGIVLVSLIVTGCFLFGPSDASIVSLSLGELPVEVSIDPSTRTVVAIAPPVDLALVKPTIGVSPGATLVGATSFADGVPAKVTVSPSFGRTVDWTVTVNVNPGVSFLLDGVRVTLLAGYTDSSDPERAVVWGSGMPGGSVAPDDSFDFWAHETVTDADVCRLHEEHGVWITLPKLSSGTYSTENEDAMRVNYRNDSVSMYATMLSVAVRATPAHIGDFATGSFSASLSVKQGKTGQEKGDPGTGRTAAHELTAGFFKVARIADGI